MTILMEKIAVEGKEAIAFQGGCRALGEYFSVVLSHPVCGALLWQPSETNPGGLGENGGE